MKMKFTLLLGLLLFLPYTGSAQSNGERCITNHNAPPKSSYYWPPDTEVKTYFHRAMFSAEEREILLVVIKGWSEIAQQSTTGIKFTYAGELDGIIDCTNCLRITRSDVHGNDPKHYAFFYPMKLDNDGLLISARIDLDFATTSPKALQAFMAHELGHGMGLWDCRTCKKKKTIMNAFPGINRDNGLIAPSSCDVETVKEIYKARRNSKKTVIGESVDGQP